MRKTEELRTERCNNFMCELVETEESCYFRVKHSKKYDYFTLEELVMRINRFLKDKGIQLQIVTT